MLIYLLVLDTSWAGQDWRDWLGASGLVLVLYFSVDQGRRHLGTVRRIERYRRVQWSIMI